MASTDGSVPWTPFAAPPSSTAPATPAASDSAESPSSTKPVENVDSTVGSPSGSESIREPAPVENSVTDRNSALRTPHSESTAQKIEPQVSVGEGVRETPHSALNSAPTDGDAESRPVGEEAADEDAEKPADEGSADEDLTFKAASRAWLVDAAASITPALSGLRPPVVWTQPPASLKDLVAYATTAPWADKTGPIRMAGRIWCWTVAVPISTVLYYLAWLLQRPSRAITIALVFVIVIQTSFWSWLWS